MSKKKAALYATGIALLALLAFIGKLTLHSPVKESSEIASPSSQSVEKANRMIPLTEEQIQTAGLKLAKAKEGTLLFKTCVPGKITANPNRYAHVVAKTDAIAKEVTGQLGDLVKPGQLLATLESRTIAEAKAEYLAALRKEALTSQLLAREQELRDKKISAEQDFFNAKTAEEEAKIALLLAKQKLLALGLSEQETVKLPQESPDSLKLYAMRAPIEGTIVKRHLTTGEFIQTNEEAFVIADLNSVWVEMGIYPKDLSIVKQGQKIEVINDHPVGKAEAQIIYLSPIIDENSHTATAIAELNNRSGNWRPGAFVCVNILTNTAQAPVLVLKEGVQNIDGMNYVFVKTEGGFEQRAVEVGESDGKQIEIRSGLKAGEMYAIGNTFVLKAELTKTAEDE